MTLLPITLGLLLVVPALAAPQDQASDFEHPSPRNANYTIEVELDPETKMISAREIITWRNIQEIPADELWFHLYWNAWRNNRSTWLLESRLRSGGRNRAQPREGDWSYTDITSIELVPDVGAPGIDLTAQMRYEAPDDGNPEDRTLAVVHLPEPVEPDELVQLEIRWRAKVPRTFARTGFRGDFFFIAQWFPKLAVLEETGWNAHQFHTATEFYSDYGVYDVRITLPSEYVVGATGREVDREERDGNTTHRYRQADVHDFAWTASPDFIVLERQFDEPPLPPVDMRLLLQPEHEAQAGRHFDATAACLRHYGKWFGAYPYDHLTIVDPAYGSGAGGMEYPTFFTAGTRLFNPFGAGSPEGVTIHECGHQFWYGVVGNNEFEHAWLDEGLNTFSTARTMDVAYGNRILSRRYLNPRGARDIGGFVPVLFESIELDRIVGGNRLDRYRAAATSDAQSTPTFQYYPGTASAHSYSKTALWLTTLERYLGWDTLQRSMSTFFDRFKFRHPTPEDFFDVVSEVSGQDMTWFFDRVYRSSDDFDYGIRRVASEPVELRGYVERGSDLVYQAGAESEGAGEIYRTEVVVERRGAGRFPVEVLMVFEDGTEVRRDWDGEARWKLYIEERDAQLDYAVVDPERRLVLDLYYTNNSRRLEPDARFPARKWASKWMIWVQDLLATFAFFV